MLTLDKIYQASHVLRSVIRKTDLIQAPKLCPDCNLFLKTENLQVTGSFKVRGAYYMMSQLTEEEKAEEKSNILNGLNFARKVVVTQECDFLVLDEILGLLDCGIITVEGIADILKHKDESMHIVMTGWNFPEELRPYVDVITTLNTEEVHPLDANE